MWVNSSRRIRRAASAVVRDDKRGLPFVRDNKLGQFLGGKNGIDTPFIQEAKGSIDKTCLPLHEHNYPDGVMLNCRHAATSANLGRYIIFAHKPNK